MPGFCIHNLEKEIDIRKIDNADLEFSYEAYTERGYHYSRNTIRKFNNDKLFYYNKKYVMVSEGVILNKSELFNKYSVEKLEQLQEFMYECKEDFFSEMRGSFSGAIYDVQKDTHIIYTNHCGDGAIYYWKSSDNSKWVVASRYGYIVKLLSENGFAINFNDAACHSMLTYGFMPDERTYVTDIFRLLYGRYIVIGKDKFEIKQYYKFENNKFDLSRHSEEEIVEELDKRFVKAVLLEYNKDKEYGYRHLTQMSGGLDSRMSLIVAQENGFDDIDAMTYEQSGSLDEKIACEIAKDMGIDLLVFPLDNAKNIMNIDRCITANEGVAHYSGGAPGVQFYEKLDMRKYGLIHTGKVGGVVVGSYIKADDNNFPVKVGGVFSKKLLNENDERICSRYVNQEEYLMSTRGFLGILSSCFFAQEHSYDIAPFTHVDFLDYCMSIPLKYRAGHRLYRKWIMKKHPNAAKYIWEKTGKKVSQKEDSDTMKRIKYAISNPKAAFYKILGRKITPETLSGMNPMDLWYRENETLRTVFEEYYSQEINKIENEKVKEEMDVLWHNGNCREKTQVLTVLGAHKYIRNSYL